MRAPFRKRVYGPLRDKKLENVLTQLFTREFGYEDKTVFAEVMVDRILSEIEHFVRRGITRSCGLTEGESGVSSG